MKMFTLAKNLLPNDVPCFEVSLPILFQGGRMPAPALWPEAKGEFDAGIMIPELEITNSIEAIKRSVPQDPFIIPAIERVLKKNEIIDENEEISPHLYCTFSILHELGHWYDLQERYIARGLNASTYLSEYRDEQMKLGLESIGKLAKAQAPGSLAHIEYLTSFHEKYREHSFERFADQFAVKKMRELIK